MKINYIIAISNYTIATFNYIIAVSNYIITIFNYIILTGFFEEEKIGENIEIIF